MIPRCMGAVAHACVQGGRISFFASKLCTYCSHVRIPVEPALPPQPSCRTVSSATAHFSNTLDQVPVSGGVRAFQCIAIWRLYSVMARLMNQLLCLVPLGLGRTPSRHDTGVSGTGDSMTSDVISITVLHAALIIVHSHTMCIKSALGLLHLGQQSVAAGYICFMWCGVR